ncbi:MFS transporter [Rhodococcus sp. WAY2]|uniref:MFS transporter n=1 Tax=Rhodococcus sp. WAY2 TaxID=2663121 RepID=UPI00131F93A5|nr:MFS transporter [Rhodococcus sp. WAY2]QHE72952.1 Vibrioferrin membrane-spanning transport protein PvsC [Rhodococcus sp. WAY2]
MTPPGPPPLEAVDRPTPTTGLRRGHVGAIAVSHCATSFAALGLPPYLSQLLPELGDPHARWAGLLYVLPTLCTALSAPVWGRLADRYGRKRLLVRAQLGLMLAFGMAALAESITTLAIALAAQGLLGGTYSASTGYLAAGLRGHALARGLAMMQISARTSLAAAPVVVGVLSTTLDIQQMYGLAALLPAVAAVAVMLLPEPTDGGKADDRAAESPPPGEKDRRITVAGLGLAEAGFVLVTVVTYPYFLPLLAQVAPGLPPVAGGLLFAAPHVCYIVASTPALRWLRDRARTGLIAGYGLAAASAVTHLVPVLLPSAPGLVFVLLGRVLLGAALTFGLTSLSLLAAEAVASRRPGRLFGTVEACSKGGAVVAGVSASALAAVGAGAPLVVSVAAGIALAAGVTRFTASRSPLPHDDSERSSL